MDPRQSAWPSRPAPSYEDFASLRTLAAAYAALGRWAEATATAEQAPRQAESQHPSAANEIRLQLQRYRAAQPHGQ